MGYRVSPRRIHAPLSLPCHRVVWYSPRPSPLAWVRSVTRGVVYVRAETRARSINSPSPCHSESVNLTRLFASPCSYSSPSHIGSFTGHFSRATRVPSLFIAVLLRRVPYLSRGLDIGVGVIFTWLRSRKSRGRIVGDSPKMGLVCHLTTRGYLVPPVV